MKKPKAKKNVLTMAEIQALHEKSMQSELEAIMREKAVNGEGESHAVA